MTDDLRAQTPKDRPTPPPATDLSTADLAENQNGQTYRSKSFHQTGRASADVRIANVTLEFVRLLIVIQYAQPSRSRVPRQ